MKKISLDRLMILASFFTLIITCLFLNALKPAILAAEEPKENSSAPRIEFKEKEFNFGLAGEGEKITHLFPFSNIGNSNLEIGEITTSCGCTAAVTTAKVIPPDGHGEIKVTFDLSRRKGLQEKEIYINSNDPKEPTVVLHLTGEVKTDIGLEPETLNLVNIPVGQSVKREIKIVQVEKEELKIDKVEANPKYFSTALSGSQKETGNKVFSLKVVLAPDAPAGMINEVITIHTNSKRRPRVDIPVLGNIVGKIIVKPTMLSLGTIGKGVSVERKIDLSREDGQGFEILKVTRSTELFSTQVLKNTDGHGYSVLVTIPGGYPAGRINETVHIHTNLKEQAVIDVPVHGIVKSAKSVSISLGNFDPAPVKWKKTKVSIVIDSGGEVIGAYSLSLKYNPKVFHIDASDLNQDGIPDVIYSTCPQFGPPAATNFDIDHGLIHLNDYQLNQDAPKGMVNLLTLSLDVIGDVDKAKDLRLHEYTITDRDGQTILSSE